MSVVTLCKCSCSGLVTYLMAAQKYHCKLYKFCAIRAVNKDTIQQYNDRWR